MELIRCPRCAREIPDFSKFCRRCGCAIAWRTEATAPFAGTAVRAESARPSRPTTTVKRPATPPARRPGGGGAGVFAIFAAAGLFFFVNYHVAIRPVMAPRAAPVVTPFAPPSIQWRTSAHLRPVPPPAPPGTTMWLDEPESASGDAYDRARHASHYVYPAQPARRR